jgi:hypothetical protein
MDRVSTCFLGLVVPCLPEVPACCWDEPCEDCACTKSLYTSLQALWRMCACACTHLALALALTLLAYTCHVLVVVVCGVQHIGKKLLLTPAMSAYVLILLKWTYVTCGGTYAFSSLQSNFITGPCLSFVSHLRRLRHRTSTPSALLHSIPSPLARKTYMLITRHHGKETVVA